MFGTIGRFLGLHTPVVELLALFAVAVAVWRRDRVTLALAAGTAAWVIVEIAFALHGWPGLARYMFEAAGVMVVLAGVGLGRLLERGSTDLPGRRVGRDRAGGRDRVEPGPACRLTRPLGARRHRRPAPAHRRDQPADGGIKSLGGTARLRACGEPLTRLEYQTMLAYQLGDNVASVGYKYGEAIAHGNPVVLFTPYPTGIGWQVQAVHQTRPSCQTLPH